MNRAEELKQRLLKTRGLLSAIASSPITSHGVHTRIRFAVQDEIREIDRLVGEEVVVGVDMGQEPAAAVVVVQHRVTCSMVVDFRNAIDMAIDDDKSGYRCPVCRHDVLFSEFHNHLEGELV